MTASPYDTIPPNRASLEQRLRNICATTQLNEQRARLALGHVVVAQMLPLGVVKGGFAIKLRVGDTASRLTRDLDITRGAGHSVDSYTNELADRLNTGWHGFTGRLVVHNPANPPEVPADYVMHPFDVKLSYQSQSFMTIRLELGHDEIDSTSDPTLAIDPGVVDLMKRLGLPPPSPVPVLAIEHQIVQKVHACTTPNRYGGNDRAHDLVDLQILVAAEPPVLRTVGLLGARLFASRRIAPWPPTVTTWPGWEVRYDEAATGLNVRSLNDAVAWLNGFIDECVAASAE